MKASITFKRLISILLSCIMVMAFVPTVALAADSDELLSKVASPLATDMPQTTVTLTLPSVEEKKDIDVVFVVDLSDYESITDIISEAQEIAVELGNMENFSAKFGIVLINKNPENITFGEGENACVLTESGDAVKDKLAGIKDAVDDTFHESPNTVYEANIQGALRNAKEILDDDTDVAVGNKYIVLLTAGVSTFYENEGREVMTMCQKRGSKVIPVNNTDTNFASGGRYLTSQLEDYDGESVQALIERNTLADGSTLTNPDVMKKVGLDYGDNTQPKSAAAMTCQSSWNTSVTPAGGYVTMLEKGFYQVGTEMLKIKEAGYNIIIVSWPYAPNPVYLGAQTKMAEGFMQWIGSYIGTRYKNDAATAEDELSTIESTMPKQLSSGTVTDVIGEKFDLVTEAGVCPFTLTVDGAEQTAATDGENKWNFGSANAEGVFPYSVSYTPGEDEQFAWTINVPSEIGVAVQLSYDLLLNDTSASGTFQTNESAKLEYKDRKGIPQTDKYFAVPEVTYTKADVHTDYTLTFVVNGGVTTPPAVTKNETDGKYTITETATNGDAEFMGWFDADGSKVIEWTPTADQTVYARFRSTYKFVVTAPDTMKIGENNTSSGAQLKADAINDVGYEHALILIEMTAKPEGSNPVINAFDGINTYNLATAGQWGSSAGFQISRDYDETTAFTGLTFDKVGTYTVEFKLVDKDNSDAVICAGTKTIVVNGYTVTFDQGANGTIPTNPTVETVADGSSATTVPTVKPNKNYVFLGWMKDNGTMKYSNVDVLTMPITADTTFIAAYRQTANTGGDGNDDPARYTLTFDANGGTSAPSVSRSAGSVISLTQTTSKAGYIFDGWYSDSDLTQKVTSVTLNSSMTVYAKWTATETPEMFREDHVAYVVGYDDGMVHPEANITRGETATIFFRLLTDDSRSSYWKTTNSFSDVNSDVWFNNAVSTMANAGVIKGYDDGTFGGGKPITRAEFAVIAARANGADGKYDGDNKFTDISDSWAEGYINDAVELGLITGYTDGTFRPNDYISRAEAMTIVNRFLARDKVDSTSLLSDMITWSDNTTSDWYYYAVQEATNSHDFNRQANDVETWTKLIEGPDWAALEKSWSTANSAK